MGFANLPNQVYRKSVKRGFEFTLMVVGKQKTSASVLSLWIQICLYSCVCVCVCPIQTNEYTPDYLCASDFVFIFV